MQHSFDIVIAEKYGVNVAIFLNNIAFWIHKNMSNQKHNHEGRYWTYNSQEALAKLFPYWSRQNIRTVIKSCIDQGLLITGNFNETGYDRTTWYALTDLGLSLFSCFNNKQIPIGENQPIEKLKPTTSLVRINQPIPDSKPDITHKEREASQKTRSAPLSDDFVFNQKTQALAEETAKRVGLTKEELIRKFKMVSKANGKILADWDIGFQLFLSNERPSIRLIQEKESSGYAQPKFWNEDHPSKAALNEFDRQHRR